MAFPFNQGGTQAAKIPGYLSVAHAKVGKKIVRVMAFVLQLLQN